MTVLRNPTHLSLFERLPAENNANSVKITFSSLEKVYQNEAKSLNPQAIVPDLMQLH